MKLKSILVLVLVTVLMVSCGLDGKLKKLEKAAMKGKAEKAVKILEKIEDKHLDVAEWTPAQFERLSASLDSLQKFTPIGEYQKVEKPIQKFQEKFGEAYSKAIK